MTSTHIKIHWPNGSTSYVKKGSEWIKSALDANIEIPTGCLNGSCGACEIDVNGETVRACISRTPNTDFDLKVIFSEDPYW
tara:strand:+ start:2457 stop:2699 length:243 start_codon:yes stop_codon:yes gene_type:complete